ncbi:hypothetical protein [Dysosmobacter sp.]|uniref:hypothetical protein n=1 Tax=Dysosmobacter sp. TaxID=2591382 RepID=UPI002A8890F9|nr:hypothetical protein [Dysosmobacter sp.]MDY3281055.1 hypothetical protein [Dysosmobacter sp.]
MKRRFLPLALAGLVCLTACGQAREVREPEPDILLKETAMVFDDGTAASLWQQPHFGRKVYRLSDGTELLTVDAPNTVDNVAVMGMEGYDALSEAAGQKVLDYFTELGILFDEERELRRAYEDCCLAQKEDRVFYTHMLAQDSSPYGENDSYLCYITSVQYPEDLRFDRAVLEDRYSVIFDKQTGEAVSPWTLFRLPEKQARQFLLDQIMRYYRGDPADAAAALKEEYIFWSERGLSIDFPQGALPGEEYAWGMTVEPAELKDVLTEKALDFSPNKS